VYVVDANEPSRAVFARLVADDSHEVCACASTREFLTRAKDEGELCVLIAPGHAWRHAPSLAGLRAGMAAVGVVAHGDVATAVALMKLGAVDVLERPVAPASLRAALSRAASRLRETRAAAKLRAQASAGVGRLTPKEREVLRMLLKGWHNSQIAEALGSRASTVKVHRSRLLRKLGARALPDLLPLAHAIDAAVAEIDAAGGRAPRISAAVS